MLKKTGHSQLQWGFDLTLSRDTVWFSPHRLSEQNKLAADQKRLVAEITEKLQEYHDWNVKYNVSRSTPYL